MSHIIRDYKNLENFLAHAIPDRKNGNAVLAGQSSSWCANTSFYQAMQLAKGGWPEGRRQAEAYLKSLEKVLPPVQHQQQSIHGMSGAYVDVGRYVDGEPECMIDFIPDRLEVRPLRILAACGATSAVDGDLIIRRGSAIAALIDILESRGYRIELTGNFSSLANSEDRYTNMFVLKDTQQPLDLDRVIFTLAHPAFSRRLGFAVKENEPNSTRVKFGFQCGSGYSSTRALPENDALLEGIDLYLPPPSPFGDYDFDSEASTLRWLTEKLAAYAFSPTGTED